MFFGVCGGGYCGGEVEYCGEVVGVYGMGS